MEQLQQVRLPGRRNRGAEYLWKSNYPQLLAVVAMMSGKPRERLEGASHSDFETPSCVERLISVATLSMATQEDTVVQIMLIRK